MIPIHVPSLNQRTEDIPCWPGTSSGRSAPNRHRPKKIADKAVKELQSSWTGNVRELRNVIPNAW